MSLCVKALNMFNPRSCFDSDFKSIFINNYCYTGLKA